MFCNICFVDHLRTESCDNDEETFSRNLAAEAYQDWLTENDLTEEEAETQISEYLDSLD